MLFIAISIDRPKSVPQLLCNRTLQCSKIFKLKINTKGFSSFLVTQLFNLKYLISFLETIHIEISSNCKTIPACSCPRLHNCCGEWEGWDPVNRFNHTSWMGTFTQTDRSKSVRNRCVIEVFGGVCALSCCFLCFFFGGCSGFCHRTEPDLFLFQLILQPDF